MAWSPSDEHLYRALRLDIELAQMESQTSARRIQAVMPTVRAEVSTVETGRKHKGIEFVFPRLRWLADPLNPWLIIKTLACIPLNLAWITYQLIRNMISTTQCLSPPTSYDLQVTEDGFQFPNTLGRASLGLVAYSRISRIGFYRNGILLVNPGQHLLLRSEDAVNTWVALTHLSKGARISPGLFVPDGFVQNCQQNDKSLHGIESARSAPGTWQTQLDPFRPAWPVQRFVGIGAAVIVIFYMLVVLKSLS